MVCGFCALREKDVINLRDGRNLGCVIDLEFDFPAGRVTGLVLPQPGKSALFSSSKNRLYIPWDRVEKIGDDAILVRCADIIPPAKTK